MTDSTHETSVMTTAAKTASQKNLSIVNARPSGSLIHSVTWSRKALTTKVNRPKVSTRAGNERNRAIGPRIALTRPKRRATSTIVTSFDVHGLPSAPKWIPLTTKAATHRATALIAVLSTKFFMGGSLQWPS